MVIMKGISNMKLRQLFVITLISLLGIGYVNAGESKIKTMILTGQSNHNWSASSNAMKAILESSGLFSADILQSPGEKESMDSFNPNFSNYKLVVLAYNGKDWPKSVQTAFEDYVRKGGGVVVYHEADNAFSNWPQYNEMIGLGGWGGRDEKSGPYVYWKDGKIIEDKSPGPGGAHGKQQAFLVINRDLSNPITKGLPQNWVHAQDELYGTLRGPAKNMTVLSTAYSDPNLGGSGRNEPVLFTIKYGKGRIFHTVLGHAGGEDVHPALECVGFIVTLQRGAQWAATGKVTQKVPSDFPISAGNKSNENEVRRWKNYKQPNIDEILSSISAYNYGQSRETLIEIEKIVKYSLTNSSGRQLLSKKFAEYLGTQASLASKQFICEQLSIIGDVNCVGALGKMLTDADTSDMARYVLDRIDLPQANEVLRLAVEKTEGKVKIGIINSIGNKHDVKALPVLTEYISKSDEQTALAAVNAIGKMGTKESAAALKTARDRSDRKLQFAILNGLLITADKFLADGDKSTASEIYKELYSKESYGRINAAALKGLAACSDEPGKLIAEALKSDNEEIRIAGAGLILKLKSLEAVKGVYDRLDRYPAGTQILLINALAEKGEKNIPLSVTEACRSMDESVRIAALKALGKIGDETAVVFLAKVAANTSGSEKQAAQQSLYNIKGEKIDSAIVNNLSIDEPKVKVELIRAMKDRGIKSDMAALIKCTKDANPQVRVEAMRALKEVAGNNDIMDLIAVVVNAQNPSEREEAKTAAAAVITEKSAEKSAAAKIVVSQIDGNASIEIKGSLIELLGKVGDNNSIDAVTKFLSDENEQLRVSAVKALSEWPNGKPAKYLLNIAKNGKTDKEKILALRGFIGLVGLDANKSEAEVAELFKEASVLSVNVAEKQKLLSEMTKIKSVSTLDLAANYLDDPQIKKETELAVMDIAKGVYESYPNQVRKSLEKILAVSDSNDIKQQAQGIIGKLGEFEDYVTNWLYAGPYSQDGADGYQIFDIAFEPEKDTNFSKWQKLPVSGSVIVDLEKLIGGRLNAAYLIAHVNSTTEQAARFEIGSDDGIKVWLNGQQVHAVNAGRPVVRGQDKVAVTLKAGDNVIMLKVTNISGPWGACLRIRAQDGGKLAGLSFE
jgi:HEAT repeat protein/type 1 glutamine amidotransferase